MSHHNRGGFTLVELLVVIVIIGMLVALLVPAVMSARESARQAKCTNNQKELGTAVVAYETSKGHYPGYVNRFGTNVDPLSWVAMVFSDLGRVDLWREVRVGRVPDVSIAQLACPSDLAWENDKLRLSYVANCGRLDQRNASPPDRPDWPQNGVFHDHFSMPVRDQVRLSASEIQDGAAQTLMLSEHVTPGQWVRVDDQGKVMPPQADDEVRIGMIWTLAKSPAELEQMRITGMPPKDGEPSSNHPGGVIVTFCDGHAQFLSDEIKYRVYQHLMTPDSRKAQQKAVADGFPDCNLAGVLSEGDY